MYNRLFLTLPHCPICHRLIDSVREFNTGRPPNRRIKIITYFSPPLPWIRSLLYATLSEEELKRGRGLPLLLFDGVEIRRRNMYHGLNHPVELLAWLEELDRG